MAFLGDISNYVFEEDDAPIREQKAQREKEANLKRTKMRLKSMTGIKTSHGVANFHKKESILQRRNSTVGDMTSRSEPIPKLKFVSVVNAVRASIRMGKAIQAPENEIPVDKKSPSLLKPPQVKSTGRNSALARRNTILSQPSPLKRAGVGWAELARMGSRRISCSANTNWTQQVDDNNRHNVASVAKLWRKKQGRFKQKGDARDLFFKAIRRVFVLLKWKSVLHEESKTVESELKTFMDLAQDFEDTVTVKSIQEKSGLSFDPRSYKANRSIKLADETKRLLTVPADCRQDECVLKAQAELQMMKSFSEYPLHMQEKLVKVAWYQEIEPRRLILREGHYAENFYFLLSGQAMVKKMLKNKTTGLPQMTTLGRLKDGQCFGEIALLHHSKRTASIETATVCHLLLIGRDDFFDIFLNTRNGEDPEHISFCRHLPFFKHWPIEYLNNNSGHNCLFHFFRRGCVIVHDSNANDWIYVVKTGSCVVLKKLKAVEPHITWKQKVQPENVPLPELGTPDIGSKTHSNYPSKRQVPVPKILQRAMTEFFATQEQTFRNETINAISNRSLSARSITSNITEVCGSTKLPESGSTRTSPDFSVNKSRHPSASHEIRDDTKRQLSASSDVKNRNRQLSGSRIQNAASPSFQTKSKTRVLERRRTSPTSSAKKRKQNTLNFRSAIQEDVHGPSGEKPCFIQLKKLVSRQTFGLETIEFENEPQEYPPTSVSLVSNGAELVMISKQFFKQHANEYVKRHIRETYQRYPQDETLQDNLQTQVNWKLYKELLVDDFVSNKNMPLLGC